MGKRRTIKIRGLRGKRHTKYPFFATEQDRRRLALVRKKKDAEGQEQPTPTTGTT